MHTKKLIMFLILIAVSVFTMFMLNSCQTPSSTTRITMPATAPNFAQMTYQQRAIYMLSIYNSQYADHRMQTGYIMDANGQWIKISNPSLTIEQRNVLHIKKDILTKVYPLIRLYSGQVESGIPPSREIEIEIMKMLNRLTS